MSGITSHVLDTSKGRPAGGVKVILEFLVGEDWQELGAGTTNDDGRIPDLLSKEHKLESGIYKLTFDTASYFQAQSVKGFYPYVQITFVISESDQHYHVPLLLSPFGYSTYRGS